MPQSPLNYTAKNVAGALAPMSLDATGKLLMTTQGGTASSLNITAAAVVKAGAGRISKIIILAPGSTSGTFTINDSATTGAAAAANAVWTLPYNGAANVAGAIFDVDWPCANGIVVSAVPGGGSPILAISYT